MPAQSDFWVFLSDKEGVSFDPYTYFDERAIERRIREGLPLSDLSDYPLRSDYRQQIAKHCDTIIGESRWFNAIACRLNHEQWIRVQDLPFVRYTVPIDDSFTTASQSSHNNSKKKLKPYQKKILETQVERMQYSQLKERGLTGQGVRIAVLDAGFKNASTDPCFAHLFQTGKVIATYDFIRNTDQVDHASSHGTQVLSCLGGIRDEIPMGCATEAEYLLARTENALLEVASEEVNWIRALEWADKMGADIINSSLGYTIQFYFRKDMDGSTPLISRAANTAVSKGILVVNSAGNDGQTGWKIMGAPADADSVLTVGGINPWSGFHEDFSSYGPTADMRMKPNVSAFSSVVTSQGFAAGTSFSSPLVAGFAACIRQMNPQWTVIQLFQELQQSADLYPYFDYAHGYGVPQASYFFNTPRSSTAMPFEFYWDDDKEILQLCPLLSDSSATPWSQTIALHNDSMYFEKPLPYLYWQLMNDRGEIEYYEVIAPGDEFIANIRNTQCTECMLRIFYHGYFFEEKWSSLIATLTSTRKTHHTIPVEIHD